MTTPNSKRKSRLVSRRRYEHLARYVAVNAGRIFSMILYKQMMDGYGNKKHLKGIADKRKE